MGAVYFYHLTDTPLEKTLPMLLDKARDAGWRILVRGTDPAVLARLDELLWKTDSNGFLPHGIAGGPNDADQPIVLAEDLASGDFACVMSVNGATITVDEVNERDRCCVLFDGHDEAALNFARGQWKTLTDAGCQAQYWAQEDGRWTKKAESGA